MPQVAVKYFTPQEAKKTLPLVKQIVKDILKTANQIKDLAGAIGEGFEESAEVKSLTAEIHSFMRELEELGCTYKDWNFEIGLVDFPSIINGQEALLCWRSDEENILHYHGLLDGFTGRKLIPEEYL
ncbi:MAG: hypothetical protein FD143_1320 [Ignavibacteria bacterium]|nr:MAG: hypothetical protein FD143_1320 [Ignavibacteria bacterium]KAF0160839.1 MAG: hypothetical protein FD188_1444 [Ignavibacteria bacterium]